MILFARFAERLVQDGDLHIEDAGGRTYRFGNGTGTRVKIKIHSKLFPWKILLHPNMALPEGYMNDEFSIVEGEIRDLLDLVKRNAALRYGTRHRKHSGFTQRLVRYVLEHNPVGRAQKNVSHHYDLDGGLYDLFLENDKQYSCAYFIDPDATLEAAQAAKKRHIASKLRIEPGHRVLDIGCGWGGLAIYLAQQTGAKILGVTLSREQHKIASERVRQMGLDGQIEIRLQDYREVEERFDRIVSVGMFEHVGVKHYGEFFDTVYRRLEDNGVALLHTIGRLGCPQMTHPWIRKYIFPGGSLPSLSQMVPCIEASGLLTCDIEILRLHYAKTLEHWAARFKANRDKARQLYDERFCRMWEVYLLSCIFAFHYDYLANFQVQMTKRLDTLPLCRDYMLDWERAEAGADVERPFLARQSG